MFRIRVDGINVAECPEITGSILAPKCMESNNYCKLNKNCNYKKQVNSQRKLNKVQRLRDLVMPHIPTELRLEVSRLINDISNLEGK